MKKGTAIAIEIMPMMCVEDFEAKRQREAESPDHLQLGLNLRKPLEDIHRVTTRQDEKI